MKRGFPKSMIRKSGYRFSDQIMLNQEALERDGYQSVSFQGETAAF
jgi:hypothetical protein